MTNVHTNHPVPDWRQTALGIELGSTRIKAVLIDAQHIPIADGAVEWENQLVDGIWTYSIEAIHEGLRGAYAALKREVRDRFGVTLREVGAIGVSGMMHGYMPFDDSWRLLVPFRTWRNTMTGEAAAELTERFGFNIPQRWSAAHLWQAVKNGEEHLGRLAHLTTLAGYIHHLLSGENVLGIGEASGMFPIDSAVLDYDAGRMAAFDELAAPYGYPWTLRGLLPAVRCAGEEAGTLTAAGARFLDPAGDLTPGIPLAPPEGDAGTGMTATNSVAVHTGNVSAGTSDFAMIVTDKPLGVHREIDMVTTPAGVPVAMVHCNNCTSDINAWVGLFGEFAAMIGAPQDKGALFTRLFRAALDGDADCGGLLSYNYLSGEGITDLDAGRPLFVRTPDSRFTVANFMRTHLLSALATLKIGLDLLQKEEKVTITQLYGHGGFFKTPGVGQRLLSAAVGAPVSVMETAGEGGPYGMALLAAYRMRRAEGETLEQYLAERVFRGARVSTVTAGTAESAGFAQFLARYRAGLPVERMAVQTL